jgi:hypothetical protein
MHGNLDESCLHGSAEKIYDLGAARACFLKRWVHDASCIALHHSAPEVNFNRCTFHLVFIGDALTEDSIHLLFWSVVSQ